MNMNNCRRHEHLASSGEVKTQQDSKSCCVRNSGLPGERGKDTPAVLMPFLRYCSKSLACCLDLSEILPFWQDSTPQAYPISFLNLYSVASALWENSQLVFSTVISGCLSRGSPLSWYLSTLFHYPICLRFLNVVKFKVNIVFLSLTLESKWANGASLLAVREGETVGESVCAAVRWCV